MKNTKKGFTIVELVIVIAVIAILAAVLIPTFSSVTNSARESAAQQEAKAGLDSVLALTSGVLPDGTLFAVSNNAENTVAYNFVYSGNKLQAVAKDAVKVEPYDKTTGETPITIYAVYVSASCWIKSSGGSVENDAATTATDNQKKVNELLKSVFAEDTTPSSPVADVTKVELSAAKVEGKDYFSATLTGVDNVEVRVYYTTDIQPTQVVFIGQD